MPVDPRTESDPVPAPPDAGGHQGTHTRPDDVLQESEGIGGAPELSSDPTPDRESSGLVPAIVLTVLGLALIGLLLYLLAWPVG